MIKVVYFIPPKFIYFTWPTVFPYSRHDSETNQPAQKFTVVWRWICHSHRFVTEKKLLFYSTNRMPESFQKRSIKHTLFLLRQSKCICFSVPFSIFLCFFSIPFPSTYCVNRTLTHFNWIFLAQSLDYVFTNLHVARSTEVLSGFVKCCYAKYSTWKRNAPVNFCFGSPNDVQSLEITLFSDTIIVHVAF